MKSALKRISEKIIHKEATSKYNEKTVAIVRYRLRLVTLLPDMVDFILKADKKVQTPLKIDWTGLKNPAVVFEVKTITERHDNDTNNWEMADKVVLAKAHAKACAIAQRVYNELHEELSTMIKEVEDVGITLNFHELRERDFVKNV